MVNSVVWVSNSHLVQKFFAFSTNFRSRHRNIARQLPTGFRSYFHFGRNQHPTAPTILQSFLGSNGHGAQELISNSLRRTPIFMDFGYALLDSLENEVPDIDNSVMGTGGRAALSTIPSALVIFNLLTLQYHTMSIFKIRMVLFDKFFCVKKREISHPFQGQNCSILKHFSDFECRSGQK